MTVNFYSLEGKVNPSGNKIITVKNDNKYDFFSDLMGQSDYPDLVDKQYISQMAKLTNVVAQISEYDPKLGEFLDQENVEINIKYIGTNNTNLLEHADGHHGNYSTNQSSPNISTIFYKDKEGKARAEININYEDLEKLKTKEDYIKFEGSLIRAINHAKDINKKDINNQKLSVEEMQMSNVEEEYEGIEKQADFINWKLNNSNDINASHILNPPPCSSNSLASKEGVLWGYSKNNYSYDEKKNIFAIKGKETKQAIKETYNAYLENQYGILLSYKNQIKKFESESSKLDLSNSAEYDPRKSKDQDEFKNNLSSKKVIGIKFLNDKKEIEDLYYTNNLVRAKEIKENISKLKAKVTEMENSIKMYDKDYTGQNVPHISD